MKGNDEMKIYHTETQADYDALMVELEEQGCKWISGDKPSEINRWRVREHLTCVDVCDSKITYASLSCYKEDYPHIPIIKYEAKVDDKMKFTKENVYKVFSQYRKDSNFPFNDLQDEITKLDDTPEKVAVPEFIANYLRRAKTDVGLMRVFEIANTKNELGKWKKEYDWIRKNSEKFAKAWIDGYTIEQ